MSNFAAFRRSPASWTEAWTCSGFPRGNAERVCGEIALNLRTTSSAMLNQRNPTRFVIRKSGKRPAEKIMGKQAAEVAVDIRNAARR